MILDIAKTWFTQPYKIGGGSMLLWYVREETRREMEIKRLRKEMNELKKR